MRVISGEKRGLRLADIKSPFIRPTTDRIKELIFNVIGQDVKDNFVLDIFAGSGSLGIEALSRGAAKAIFIENNIHARKVLCKNLQKTGFVDRAEILGGSAFGALKGLASASTKFDLVLADPPYRKEYVKETIEAIDQAHLLAPDGWLVIEHHYKDEWSERAAHLKLSVRKRQGDSKVSFYRHA